MLRASLLLLALCAAGCPHPGGVAHPVRPDWRLFTAGTMNLAAGGTATTLFFTGFGRDLDECLGLAIPTAILPDLAALVRDGGAAPVMMSVDVSACVERHGAPPVEALQDPQARALMALAIRTYASGVVEELAAFGVCEVDAWAVAVASTLESAVDGVLLSLATAGGVASAAWPGVDLSVCEA